MSHAREGDGSDARAIIVLSSLRAEGTPIMALDLAREWRARGIRPTILTLFDAPDDLAGEFASLEVPVLRATIPSSGKRRYAEIVRTVMRAARHVRPGAVLSMPFGWHAFVSIGARLAGVPVTAAHVGSYPPHWQGHEFWKFKAEVLLGRPFTTRLLCCSRYVQEGVHRHFGFASGETVVAYNGCDTRTFERRAALTKERRRPGAFRVGMVGRVDASKDFETLLRAIAVVRRNLAAELWIVGDGAARPGLERLTLELGIADAVRFLGIRRDVPDLLGELDVFAFSVKRDEGLGIALVEAMAAHVPIVASDVGACREVLDGGELGRLVAPGDADALAAGILEVARRPGELEGRVERAAAKAHATFSRESMAEAYARHLELSR